MENEKTHWLQSPNKNYLGHWDLPGGNNLILTIKSAKWEEVKNPIINTKEAKRVIRFNEKFKPLICNQTNANAILKSTGIKFMEDSVGCKIELYIDNIQDKRTKEYIDCIRVKSEKPKQKEILNERHPKWEKAKENVKNGSIDLEGLRKYWIVSDDIFSKLKI
jgi:hypothetical protein